jgi:hypothetical protein
MLNENLNRIQERIARAASVAHRAAEDIRIVAAAKTQTASKIKEALDAGIRIIGHNYVQEAMAESVDQRPPDSQIHMIGHLQRNKANKAVELFDVVETVDNEGLAQALDKRARAANRTIGILIQVNLAEEPQKSGIHKDDLEQLINVVRSMENLRLLGLMTMPPFFDDPDRARPYFSQLRETRDRFYDRGILTKEMNELSMGMTGDFEVAIEEGSTLVRIGTALFGPRG